MYSEGTGITTVGWVLGVKSATFFSWVKKARQARELMGQMTRLRAERRPGMPSARVISFDEVWTYVGARHGEKRREVWIWTAVVEEADGWRWGCFQVGDRSEETLLRLLEQLPEAGRYRSDDYKVYGFLPRNRHGRGKGGEPESGDLLAVAGPFKAAATGNQRVQQERGDVAGLGSLGVPEAGLNLNASAC